MLTGRSTMMAPHRCHYSRGILSCTVGISLSCALLLLGKPSYDSATLGHVWASKATWKWRLRRAYPYITAACSTCAKSAANCAYLLVTGQALRTSSCSTEDSSKWLNALTKTPSPLLRATGKRLSSLGLAWANELQLPSAHAVVAALRFT